MKYWLMLSELVIFLNIDHNEPYNSEACNTRMKLAHGD